MSSFQLKYIPQRVTIIVCWMCLFLQANWLVQTNAFSTNFFSRYPNKQPKSHSMQYYPSNTMTETIIQQTFSFRPTSKPRYTLRSPPSSSRLFLSSQYDNLVSGIAEISLGTSLGVLWSEYAILTTGCGPMNLSDGLERFCYQAVITFAGVLLFSRILTQKDAVTLSTDYFGDMEDLTLYQVKAAEVLAYTAVLGAFVALGSQMTSGVDMDGLSGIDVQMCRAIREL